jgi:hypothetical protein
MFRLQQKELARKYSFMIQTIGSISYRKGGNGAGSRVFHVEDARIGRNR